MDKKDIEMTVIHLDKVRVILLLIPLVFLAGCARAPEGQAREAVDPGQLSIYHSGSVITMEADQPIAEAIAILGDSIAAVGTNERILALQESGSILIDLDGRTVMPGFVDAHTHILNDSRSMGRSLDEAQFEALRNGITSLGTLYVNRSFLGEIQDFNDAGYLRVRTSLYLVHTDPCGKEVGDWWLEYPVDQSPAKMLRIAGVKIFTDGGSCGKVALSFELEPGWGTGDLWHSQEELNEMVGRVHDTGYQAAVHAIGDRAVVQALNAFEEVLDGQPNSLRHRMEHVSVIPPDQIPRFGELGIIPVLNGEYPSCSPFGPPIPKGYREMEWPWRALRETNSGLPIAWHSDVPFLSGNPFTHLLGFVTRIDRAGPGICPPEDWLADDTIPVEEALSIMTIQSALALSRDNEVGSLIPGKFADMIVLSNNPLDAESDMLAQNRVLLTVVGGRIEYCRATDGDLCPGFSNRTPVTLPDTRPPVVIRWLVAALLTGLPLAAMTLRRRRAKVLRWIGAWAGILAGIVWLFMLFSPEFMEDVPVVLLMISGFLMGLGTVGIAALWKHGKFGDIALWTALFGAVVFSEAGLVGEWFLSDLGWGMFLVGILAHMVGLALFGVANIRGKVFPRLNAIPLLMGLLGGAGFGLLFILADNADPPFFMILLSLGAGWVSIGWMLLKARTTR
jgi:predicted amidohydrolase YtcJ